MGRHFFTVRNNRWGKEGSAVRNEKLEFSIFAHNAVGFLLKNSWIIDLMSVFYLRIFLDVEQCQPKFNQIVFTDRDFYGAFAKIVSDTIAGYLCIYSYLSNKRVSSSVP